MKKITFLLSFFALLQLSVSAQTYSFEKWLNGKKSATVLTFDDWSPGHGPIGVPGLNAKGLVGSFFITTANVSNWQPIRDAATAGHEIGNHTKNHPDLPTRTAAELIDEITNARTLIESQLPAGKKVQTLVYPRGLYNDAVIAETQKNHFSARTYIEPVPANLTFPYNFATIEKDYYTLNTVPVDVNMTPTILGNWIQQGINSNGLLTFTFHSLNNASVSDSWWDPISETQYLSLLDKVVTYQSQTWVTTYANAVKYHKEAKSATLTTVSTNADLWVLNLTDAENNLVFNHPLTINLQKITGETYSSISQNGVSIPFSTVGDNLVFNAIPDGGNISINKSGVSIVLNSPVNGAVFTGLNPVTLSATPTVVGTTVSNVTYTIGAQSIVVNASPFTASWTPVASGSYTVTAKVNAANGKSATASAVITINQQASCTDPAWDAAAPYGGASKVSYNNRKYTANWWNQNMRPDLNAGSGGVWTDNGPCGSGNTLPTVSLTAPTVLTYTAPATVTIAANAADTDGTITKVEFYNGAALLNADMASPFTYSWTGLAAGAYSITAKAYDNAGGITTSSAISITVNAAGNAAPTVNLTAPTVLTYTAPATVTIAANAADTDGTITKVEFYNGAALLNADMASPFTYSWTGLAAGTYSITAKAYDNTGTITTSSAVSITVNPAGGTCTAPQYVAGTTYATGASVQNNGHKYTCTVGGWCSSASAYYYAPGTGTAWTSAWTDSGNCTSRIGETETVSAILIYPNPSTGSFVIHTEEASTAVITNTFGSEVASVTLVKGSNEVNLLLTSGIYIVNINNQVTKLVIE